MRDGESTGRQIQLRYGAMNGSDTTAWRAFLAVHAKVTKTLEAELRTETGLHLAWYDALVQLSEAGGSLRMHELAERMMLSRSAATRFADRLERAGLVERRGCDRDRRGTRIGLTPHGRALLRRAAAVHLRGVEGHFARHLSDEEAATLAHILGKILVAETGIAGHPAG